MKELTICDNCGEIFLKEEKEKRRRLKKDRYARFFCSQECVLKGKRTNKLYPDRLDCCANCGKEFTSRWHNRKQGYSRFCSRYCAAHASSREWYVKRITGDY